MNLAAVGLSIYAALMATSAKRAAKRAAETVVERKNRQEDTDRLTALLAALVAAKDVAMRRQGGAARFLSAGHQRADDFHVLRTAQDCLLTRLPMKLGNSLRVDAKSAADELGKAIESIEIDTDRDGWKDALVTLQILIPSLEQEDRRRRDRELLEHVHN
jgi:hypothetical protein